MNLSVGDLVTLARSNGKIIGLVTKITDYNNIITDYNNIVWVRWFQSLSNRDIAYAIDKSVGYPLDLLQKYVSIEERGTE
jgi:hypothetical protein